MYLLYFLYINCNFAGNSFTIYVILVYKITSLWHYMSRIQCSNSENVTHRKNHLSKNWQEVTQFKTFHQKRSRWSVEENQTTEELDSQASVLNGARRVIELDILIEDFRSSVHCFNPLRLERPASERKYDLSEFF